MSDRVLRIGGLRLSVHAFIYGTILMQVTLAVYDEDEASVLTAGVALELIAVIVGSLAAVAVAHTLADTASTHIDLGRFPTGRDFAHILRMNAQYLYVSLVPIAIILANLDGETETLLIVWVIQALGVLSLFGWGMLAGSKAGRWPALFYGLAYGALGAAVVQFEVWVTH